MKRLALSLSVVLMVTAISWVGLANDDLMTAYDELCSESSSALCSVRVYNNRLLSMEPEQFFQDQEYFLWLDELTEDTLADEAAKIMQRILEDGYVDLFALTFDPSVTFSADSFMDTVFSIRPAVAAEREARKAIASMKYLELKTGLRFQWSDVYIERDLNDSLSLYSVRISL